MPNLAEGADAIGRRLGVRPTPGGQHAGLGTANQLVGLGHDCYLEIIGPDPNQPTPAGPRPFGLDTLTEPRLVTWALRETDLDARVAALRARAYDPGPVLDMHRVRADGTRLAWRLAIRGPAIGGAMPHGDRLIPFLIDWGDTAHPASTLESTCRLLSVHARHPDPSVIRPLLAALDVPLDVERAPVAGLVATLRCPAGIIELS